MTIKRELITRSVLLFSGSDIANGLSEFTLGPCYGTLRMSIGLAPAARGTLKILGAGQEPIVLKPGECAHFHPKERTEPNGSFRDFSFTWVRVEEKVVPLMFSLTPCIQMHCTGPRHVFDAFDQWRESEGIRVGGGGGGSPNDNDGAGLWTMTYTFDDADQAHRAVAWLRDRGAEKQDPIEVGLETDKVLGREPWGRHDKKPTGVGWVDKILRRDKENS